MTAKSGAGGRSAKVTVTPPRLFDKGIVSARAMLLASPVPKIETKPPGDTGCPLAKLAPLMTPPAATLGPCAWHSAAPPKAITIRTYFIGRHLVRSYCVCDKAN